MKNEFVELTRNACVLAGRGWIVGVALALFLCGCVATVQHRHPAPPPPPRNVVVVESHEVLPYVPMDRVAVHPVREFHKNPKVDYRKPAPRPAPKPAPKVQSRKPVAPKPAPKMAKPKSAPKAPPMKRK